MKVLLLSLLISLHVRADSPLPETKHRVIDGTQPKDWTPEDWTQYAGHFVSLDFDDTGNDSVVFTVYVGLDEEPHLSLVRIKVPMLAAEPNYTVRRGKLGYTEDKKCTGVLSLSDGKKWRFVTYIDPKTSLRRYGVKIDNHYYVCSEKDET